LLDRAFGRELLACSRCSGMRRVLAAIRERRLAARDLGAAIPVGELAAEQTALRCRLPR
jgi:hypothetical protein